MAKLLQGYTQVLSPVNLLPNANFSRGGGIPNSINYTNSTFIDENKTIRVQRGTWTDNGSQRLGGGEFRLKGWIRRSSAGYMYVVITVGSGNGTGFMGNNGVPFTVAFKAKNNMPSEGSVILRAQAGASGAAANLNQYYVRNPIIGAEYVEAVGIYFSTSLMALSLMISPENSNTLGNDPIYIDVTIKDLRVFEGAYINPPLGHSLDTNALPLFITHNMGDEVTLDMRAGFPVQRIREITIPSTTTGLSKIQVRLSSKTIASDGYEHIFVAYLYEVLGDRNLSTVFKRHLIKYLARNYNGTAAIRHKSITLQDDYTMRFPTNSQGAAYATTLITWDLDSSSVSSQKSSTCVLTGVATQLPPSTKLYIQPLVIEDSGNYNSQYPWYKTYGWPEVFS